MKSYYQKIKSGIVRSTALFVIVKSLSIDSWLIDVRKCQVTPQEARVGEDTDGDQNSIDRGSGVKPEFPT
jgi:DNA-directed RNA polymerase alpha subunit